MRLSPSEKRRRNGKAETKLRNVLRRLALKSADALEWVLVGLKDAAGNVETEKAELFGMAGVATRPPEGAKAEAILAYLGGDANAPIILVTRDADTLRAFIEAEGQKSDESALFTSQATLRITEDGKVVARSLGGQSQPLATLADLEAHKTWSGSHTHTISSGSSAGTTTPPIAGPPTPAGTSVLEGE